MRRCFTGLLLLLFVMAGYNSKAQCTWHQTLFDSFEYTSVCPDIIPGMTYQTSPQQYSVHTGNYSLYMNFVNCVSGVGACPGDSIYIRNVAVCPGQPVRFSMWFTTTFSGTQCDIQIKIVDTLGIVLANTPSLLPDYSPLWTQYTSPVVYPLTSNIQFIIYTNAGGSGGGNDLSLDDFAVEKCYEDVTLGPDTTICSNQTVTLVPAGSFVNYLWNDGSTADSLVAFTTNITDTNSYYVYVTDSNGCVVSSDTAQVFFTDCNLTPVIALSSSDTVFCEKQCLDFFDLSTNSPTSWQWLFTGASPDTSTLQNPTGICYNNYGSFDVTLIACNSSGCDTLHLTDFITELQNPTDSIYFSADTLYSLPAYSYQWYEASGGLIAGAVNQYFIAQLPGNYYCVVSDSIGCIATSNILTATTLNENGLQLKAYLFPNPGNGSFKILLPEYANCASMKIFNSVGKTVFDKTISGDNFYLETDLSDGLYFMQIIAGSKLYSEKLIIEKP